MEYTTEDLLAYLEGGLSAEGEAQLKRELDRNPALYKTFDELRTVWEGMEDSVMAEPSPKLSEAFYQMLEEEEEKAKHPTIFRKLQPHQTWIGRVAAGIMLFCAGYFIDKQLSLADLQVAEVMRLQKEVAATKSLVMMSMLQNSSASSRIQGVQYSYEVKGADDEIIKALIHTMNYDESVNVQMAATEALYQFAHIQAVRAAMVQALRGVKEPEIQLMLIDMLVSLKASEALPTLRNLSKSPDLMPLVKSKASEGVEVLL